MKYKITIVKFLTLIAASASLFAESPAERDMQQLKEQRDKAVVSATKAIDVRYQASLEQILSKAIQAKDAAGAETIKAELLTLGPLKPAPLGAATPPPAKIPGNVLGAWKVNDASGWTATYEFKADGTCAITLGSAKLPDKVIPCTRARDKIELQFPDGKVQAFDLPPKAGKMDGYRPDGAKLWANKIPK